MRLGEPTSLWCSAWGTETNSPFSNASRISRLGVQFITHAVPGDP